MSTSVLSPRVLGRALLERQCLLRKVETSPLQMIEHLVGLQAQLGDPPYYQLWSRIADFDHEQLSDLLRDRRAVRVALMRGTVHLVSAADCMPLRAAIQPYLSRTLFSGSQYGKRIQGVDPDALAKAATELLADGPLTNDELGRRLHQRWPQYAGNDLAYGARGLIPLVQVPPRGIWGSGGTLTYASAMQWLDTEPVDEPPMAEIVLRYLRAFGPAGVADFQKWATLTRVKPVFDGLRDQLVTYHDENGKELFDVAGTELPDVDTPVPPTLIGPFDNLLLSHADKSRIITKEHEKRVFGPNGVIRGTYLLDGRVAGAWKVERSGKRRARLRIERFTSATATQIDELADRAERLLDFAAPETADRTVEFH